MYPAKCAVRQVTALSYADAIAKGATALERTVRFRKTQFLIERDQPFDVGSALYCRCPGPLAPLGRVGYLKITAKDNIKHGRNSISA